MEPRMYRAEPSLVMNAERSEPKLPLCPSCARNMRLIRRTQRFDTLPDVCRFECRGCGVSHFEEREPTKSSGALISNDKENAGPNPSPVNGNCWPHIRKAGKVPLANFEATNGCDAL
jgi:hypothetical protein